MIRGIGEKSLLHCLEHGNCDEVETRILRDLLKLCVDLNPWYPIATAPKETKIILYYPRRNKRQPAFQIIGYYPSIFVDPWQPTHWKHCSKNPDQIGDHDVSE